MKKHFTKLLGAVLAIALMVTIIPAQPTQAASKILPNKWYTFTVNGTKKNSISYKVPSNGYFYIQVVPLYTYHNGEAYQNDTWYIPNITIKHNYKILQTYKAYYKDGITNSQKYSFKKGSTLQINLSEAENWKSTYKIRIVHKKPKYFETETNNSKKTANPIKQGKSYTGLCMKDDTDYFIFKAPSSGKYKVNAVITQPETDHHLSTSVNKGTTLVSSKLIYAGEGWKNISDGYVALKKGQKLYIKITDGGYEFYKIKVTKKK